MQERMAMEKNVERLSAVMDLLVDEFTSEASKSTLKSYGATAEQIIEYRRIALDGICRVADAITYACDKARNEITPTVCNANDEAIVLSNENGKDVTISTLHGERAITLTKEKAIALAQCIMEQTRLSSEL